jgi:tetratricopeptide (TPR) repeat protein
MEPVVVRYVLAIAIDAGWDDLLGGVERRPQTRAVWDNFTWAAVRVGVARLYARLGKADAAMALVGEIVAALERAPAWAQTYIGIACDAAATLWLAERTDHASVIEHALRNVVAIDFRAPMRDARLGLAQLCALRGRYDEAVEWFAKARIILDEQGAPLRVSSTTTGADARLSAARTETRRALPAALEQFGHQHDRLDPRAEELLPTVSRQRSNNRRADAAVGPQPETKDQTGDNCSARKATIGASAEGRTSERMLLLAHLRHRARFTSAAGAGMR